MTAGRAELEAAPADFVREFEAAPADFVQGLASVTPGTAELLI